MDLAIGPRKTRSPKPRKSETPAPRHAAGHYAVEEIGAYIAVRDGLLEEAEQTPSLASVERLVLANNFVAHCLTPMRQPYALQCLPETEAARELQRCGAIEARIVKLRTRSIAARG